MLSMHANRHAYLDDVHCLPVESANHCAIVRMSCWLFSSIASIHHMRLHPPTQLTAEMTWARREVRSNDEARNSGGEESRAGALEEPAEDGRAGGAAGRKRAVSKRPELSVQPAHLRGPEGPWSGMRGHRPR